MLADWLPSPICFCLSTRLFWKAPEALRNLEEERVAHINVRSWIHVLFTPSVSTWTGAKKMTFMCHTCWRWGRAEGAQLVVPVEHTIVADPGVETEHLESSSKLWGGRLGETLCPPLAALSVERQSCSLSMVGHIPLRCFLRPLPGLHLQLGLRWDCRELILLLWRPAWWVWSWAGGATNCSWAPHT